MARSNHRIPSGRQAVSEDDVAGPRSEVRPHLSLCAGPWLAITAEWLPLLPLDARAAYLLSLVDGRCSVEMILDICGPEVERDGALGILTQLLQLGAIELRDP